MSDRVSKDVTDEHAATFILNVVLSGVDIHQERLGRLDPVCQFWGKVVASHTPYRTTKRVIATGKRLDCWGRYKSNYDEQRQEVSRAGTQLSTHPTEPSTPVA